MPHIARLRPLQVLNPAAEARLDPLHTPVGRRVDLLRDLEEGALLFRRHAELDGAPRHDLPACAVHADKQIHLRFRAVSEDHRVGLLPVLDLEPVVRAGVELVARVLALGDDAL